MRAVMNTDASGFRSTEAAGAGSRSAGKTENSFLEVFQKTVADRKKPEPPREKRTEVSAGGQQTKDISDRASEEISTMPEKEAGQAVQEKPQKEKDQTSDPVLAMLMLNGMEMLQPEAEETAGFADGLLQEETALGSLQAASLPDAGQSGMTDLFYVLQDQNVPAAENGEEALLSTAGLEADGTASEMLQGKEDVSRTGSFAFRPTELKADARTAMQEETSGAGMDSDYPGLLKAQSEFMRSMAHSGREAAKDSSQEQEAGPEQGLEELRRNASANGVDVMGRFTASNLNGRFKVPSGSGESLESTPVLDQIQTGLQQALKSRQELTVHLKPEGLGDIVIRLANSDGKVTVNIGVSNSDTQKLITSQMADLKEMLEPLHAEVGEVYHDSQAAMNFLEYGQQMQEQENRHQAGSSGRRGRAAVQEEDQILAVAEQMMAESAVGRLYAYI